MSSCEFRGGGRAEKAFGGAHRGAGIYLSIGSTADISNSLFADFTAYSGAAVSVQRSSCVVRDSNFLRNSILGGGIGSAIAMTLPCEVDLYGCLFEYNNMAAVLLQNINYQHKVIRFIFRFNEGSNLLGESLEAPSTAEQLPYTSRTLSLTETMDIRVSQAVL